jgi:hypothetical protein
MLSEVDCCQMHVVDVALADYYMEADHNRHFNAQYIDLKLRSWWKSWRRILLCENSDQHSTSINLYCR